MAVHKLYMERRTYAAFKKQWPEINVIVMSQRVSYEQYNYPNKTYEQFVEVVVGDMHRIWTYAEKGFQIAQEVPDNVKKAYGELVDLGYDKHV